MRQVADTFIPEEVGYPTINIKVDRVTAARLGLNQNEVVSNVITALTSNAVIDPSIWIDPVTGDDYFLTAQYAEQDIRSLDTLRDIPVRSSTNRTSRNDALMLRSVATLERQAHPAEADHYNIQRVVDVLVSPTTQDAGGTQQAIEQVVKKVPLPQRRFGRLPRCGIRDAGILCQLRLRSADGRGAAVPGDGGAV